MLAHKERSCPGGGVVRPLRTALPGNETFCNLSPLLYSESPSVLPLKQWHGQILDCTERWCQCPGFSSNPSLWLCWWHCSHFKYGWKSATPTEQTLWLYTFQRAQAEHWQNKSHGLLQQGYFCDSHLRFPPLRTTARLWNLSLNSNTLESLLLVMEACSQLLEGGRQLQVCHCQSL